MTPLQAAKAHCANYQSDGSCLGMYYNDDLSVDHSKYRPCARCLLADGKRCEYFEECVMPMPIDRVKHPKEAAGFAAACHEYRRSIQGAPSAIKRLCRACRKCEVVGLKRFCGTCAEKRERAGDRLRKQKSRLDVRKTENSRIQIEALTNDDQSDGYD
jgi:hypothetical protein